MKKLLVGLISLSLLLGNPNQSKEREGKNQKNYVHYKNLIENKIPQEVATKVFDNRFRVYDLKRRKKRRITYEVYEKRINPEEKARIAVKFLVENYNLLKRIQESYGINALDIASLVSIETAAGKYLGSYEMFNAVYSQFLYYDKRYKETKSKYALKWRNFYLDQLRSMKFLLKQNYDFFLPSSISGAIGIGQFMPSSIMRYGVDADRDGVIEMFEIEDALLSIANYLKKHQGDKNIEKAYKHYNGHIWYVLVLRKIRKRAKEIIKNKFRNMFEKKERKFCEKVEISTNEIFYLRETKQLMKNRIVFISNLELLKNFYPGIIKLNPSNEKISICDDKKSF